MKVGSSFPRNEKNPVGGSFFTQKAKPGSKTSFQFSKPGTKEKSSSNFFNSQNNTKNSVFPTANFTSNNSLTAGLFTKTSKDSGKVNSLTMNSDSGKKKGLFQNMKSGSNVRVGGGDGNLQNQNKPGSFFKQSLNMEKPPIFSGNNIQTEKTNFEMAKIGTKQTSGFIPFQNQPIIVNSLKTQQTKNFPEAKDKEIQKPKFTTPKSDIENLENKKKPEEQKIIEDSLQKEKETLKQEWKQTTHKIAKNLKYIETKINQNEKETQDNLDLMDNIGKAISLAREEYDCLGASLDDLIKNQNCVSRRFDELVQELERLGGDFDGKNDEAQSAKIFSEVKNINQDLSELENEMAGMEFGLRNGSRGNDIHTGGNYFSELAEIESQLIALEFELDSKASSF